MTAISRWRARLAATLRRRRQLVGINRRNLELVYARNPRRHYPLADDKLRAKQGLAAAGVPVPETLAVCDGLFAIPKLMQQLDGAQQFVIKPANGSGGDGILVVGDRAGDGAWYRAGGERVSRADLQRHLANVVFGAFSRELEDRAFVERRVRPHPVYRELWADGLCDIRVITVDGAPVLSMVRVPTRMSGGRANLHQGGVGLAVDLARGVTTRAVHRRTVVDRHPESGVALVGIELPEWPAVVDVARRAAAAVPLGYLGVDVVVDADRGPLVLEINARPGIEIQNVHGAGMGLAVTGGGE